MTRKIKTGDPAPLTLKEWYTVKEAALMCDRHPTLIHRWIATGRIPSKYVAEGGLPPFPTLLSPLALAQIVSLPKRQKRPTPPEAYRPRTDAEAPVTATTQEG